MGRSSLENMLDGVMEAGRGGMQKRLPPSRSLIYKCRRVTVE